MPVNSFRSGLTTLIIIPPQSNRRLNKDRSDSPPFSPRPIDITPTPTIILFTPPHAITITRAGASVILALPALATTRRQDGSTRAPTEVAPAIGRERVDVERACASVQIAVLAGSAGVGGGETLACPAVVGAAGVGLVSGEAAGAVVGVTALAGAACGL